jgi:hypothetical protein
MRELGRILLLILSVLSLYRLLGSAFFVLGSHWQTRLRLLRERHILQPHGGPATFARAHASRAAVLLDGRGHGTALLPLALPGGVLRSLALEEPALVKPHANQCATP